MRKIGLVLLILILSLAQSLFAFGRREVVEEEDPVNPQWTLCITAFDVSEMSPAWQTAGDLAARNLVNSLQNLGIRFRGDDEIKFYQDYQWARARASVARNLAAKRDERDRLIYRGDPQWRYERNLKSLEDQIADLEEQLREIDEQAPVVQEQPEFLLCENNRNGIFPEPPVPGMEFRFTSTNSIDAFVTGSFSEFYGRVFLEIRMYTRYNDSYSFEDSILFSADDFNEVIAEFSESLAIAVSVNMPSSLVVHSDPPDAIVVLDGTFLSQEQTRILSPGTVEISAIAEHHLPSSISLDLNSGELAEVYFSLTPFALTAFQIDAPEHPGSNVFLGSLYMGEAPLILQLPVSEFSYISVVTPEGEVGTGIFRDNMLVRGSANFTPGDGRADFFTAPPAHKDDEIVEGARREFYKSWGALWITLPVSMLIGGIAGSYIASNDHVIANNLHPGDPNLRQRINDRATIGNFVTYGTYGLIGGALGWTFFNIFRYLRASSGDATPIAIVPEPEPEPEIEEELEEEELEDEELEDEELDEEELENAS